MGLTLITYYTSSTLFTLFVPYAPLGRILFRQRSPCIITSWYFVWSTHIVCVEYTYWCYYSSWLCTVPGRYHLHHLSQTEKLSMPDYKPELYLLIHTYLLRVGLLTLAKKWFTKINIVLTEMFNQKKIIALGPPFLLVTHTVKWISRWCPRDVPSCPLMTSLFITAVPTNGGCMSTN